jgi:hypothetical protein
MAASQAQHGSLIYIMGDGRSGSTVVGIVLGNHPSISSNGELWRWPEFGGYPKPDNKKEEDHRFWGAVRECYLEQELPSDMAHLVELQSQIEEYRELPKVLMGVVPQSALHEYHAFISGLLRAITTVSGKGIIVDESKRPGRGHVLLRSPDVDVRLIHLVRDPRGVIWSSGKQDVEQPYKSPAKASIHYLTKNLACLLVNLMAPRGTVLRVRYEDLVRKPVPELRRIGHFLNLSMEPVIEKIESGEALAVPHLLDGNRIRHQRAIHLRLDDGWRRGLPARDRLLTELLTFPFFIFFGYWKYPYD